MSNEKPLPDWMLERIGRYAVAVERHATGKVRTDIIRMAEWEQLIEAILRYGRERAWESAKVPTCTACGGPHTYDDCGMFELSDGTDVRDKPLI